MEENLDPEDLKHACPACSQPVGEHCRRVNGQFVLNRAHQSRRMEWDVPF